jgi:hypothetical protein
MESYETRGQNAGYKFTFDDWLALHLRQKAPTPTTSRPSEAQKILPCLGMPTPSNDYTVSTNQCFSIECIVDHMCIMFPR